MTRAVNARRKRAHMSLWDNRKTHICPIEDEEGLLNALAYIAAKPVQDGIVPRGSMWTRVRTLPMHLGTTQERDRPVARLFSNRSRMPKKVALQFCSPPMLARWDRDALVAELDRRIEHKESASREAMNKAGRSFLGLKEVRATRDDSTCDPQGEGGHHCADAALHRGQRRGVARGSSATGAVPWPLPVRPGGVSPGRPRRRVSPRHVPHAAHGGRV